MFSGYFSCLVFKYANLCFDLEQERYEAAQVLVYAFQRACFIAVVVALTIVILVEEIPV